MSTDAKLELKTLTIRIPMRLARRGGRKLILTPDGAAPAPQLELPDDTMVKALVRAHRWRRRIESGEAASITEVAERESVTAPYVFRLLRLTCLAPDIVVAILDGRHPKGAALADLVREVPLAWSDQVMLFEGFSRQSSLAFARPYGHMYSNVDARIKQTTDPGT